MIGRIYLILVATALAGQVFGQCVTQQVDLQPGWNSVYLTVQPVPGSCSELFGGLPVERISWWCRQAGMAEFDSDPQQTFPRPANWRNWYADDPTASTFGSLICGEAYMVKVAAGATPFSFDVKGVPMLGQGDWLADEYGFSGLPVLAGNTLSFGHFFGFTDEINPVNSTDIYKLDTDGTYDQVYTPAYDAAAYGQAYWIKGGARNSDYYGPLNVKLLSPADTMDFSNAFTAQRLEIENLTDADRVVTIGHLASDNPPDGGLPAVAGKVPLNMARLDLTGYTPFEEYVPLPDSITTNIAAGESVILKLLPSRILGEGLGEGEAWQSILQVTDENNNGETEATVLHQVGVFWIPAEIDHTGLWVGSVAVANVSRAQTQSGVSNVWDHTEPVPVVRPYVFRVLIHLDEGGEARLMQRVLPAWIPDAEIVLTGEGIQTNGIYELFTDESFAEQCLQNHPNATITRISSVNLPLMDPVLMSGSFGGTNALDCTVDLPYNDPVNPFMHRYHPMHDNLEYNNDGSTSTLDEGVEAPTVSRTMSFAFVDIDPERGLGNPQWGVSEMGGTFTEEVTGLNKTIFVQGPFRLQKVNDCGVLKYLEQ